MGGSGIRAYELARALRPHADVVIAAPRPREPAEPRALEVPVHEYDFLHQRGLRPVLDGADFVVAQPPWPHIARELERSGARLVFDLYNPEPLEVLEHARRRGATVRRVAATLTVDRIADALHRGHHVMCASEKQRDLYLGAMLAARLIAPAPYDRDPSLRSLIDVVPFGVPRQPPRPGSDAIRARFPEIAADDEVVLWNGGIWSWLDAPTAVRAAALLAERRPGTRLVFMAGAGTGAAAAAAEEARRVASELGVLGGVVLFNDRWVSYESRADWLLAADCGVSTHHEHLETRFAFRTRLLDCFWAGLPVVCTRGDELADRVERDGLGAAVPERDPAALADALERVLDQGRAAYTQPLADAAADLAWDRVTAPLARWIAHGRGPSIGTPAARRPGHVLRSAGFRAAVEALRLSGRGWPRL